MAAKKLRVAGIFAGVGGLELGLARAGHHTDLLCEIEPGAVAVLRDRFPGVPVHQDVRTLARFPKSVDLVVGGFPCQDLSQAGLTKGLGGKQSSLVDEVFRLLRVSDVPWVVLETVPCMLQLGRGNAIRHVTGELERLGYEWAYRVIDTRAFGLPQRRERVFIVASKEGDPSQVLFEGNREPRETPHTAGVACGFFWTEGLRGLGWAVDAVPTLKGGSTIGIPSPPAIWMPDGGVLKLGVRDGERLQGFETDWTLPAEAVAKPSARWGLVGSAVSVPVAEWIGSRLNSPGAYDTGRDGWFSTSGMAPRAARFDGKRRFAVSIGTDPIGLRPPSITTFMRDSEPKELLSAKATVGFLMRTRRAKLKFAPGFIEAVERHCLAMGGVVPPRNASLQLDLLAA